MHLVGSKERDANQGRKVSNENEGYGRVDFHRLNSLQGQVGALLGAPLGIDGVFPQAACQTLLNMPLRETAVRPEGCAG